MVKNSKMKYIIETKHANKHLCSKFHKGGPGDNISTKRNRKKDQVDELMEKMINILNIAVKHK